MNKLVKQPDSKKFNLNMTDVGTLFRNASFVALAAGLAYFSENAADLDLGSASALIVPIFAIVMDSLVKWVKDNSDNSDKE